MNRLDQSASGANHIGSWANTTAGVVLSLIAAQFITGVLLAFYYVPSVDHAYTTVSFVEKVLSSGTWIRSFHYYCSQWLAFFAFLHLTRLFLQRAYEQQRFHWISAVLILVLIMGAAATGYSLPWDARAFFSTRIAEGLLGGLPIIGAGLRLWLLGSDQISALTLSRFFALHVLVTPFLIAIVIGIWLRSIRTCGASLLRQSLAALVVFGLLAIWSSIHPAPLGPAAGNAGAEYLPRPGGQFLWLYQSLKYIPGALGSIVGVVLPSLAVTVLVLLPLLPIKDSARKSQRLIGGAILSCLAVLIAIMTLVSYFSDRRDPRVREQLARQAAAEDVFRHAPFVPDKIQPDGARSTDGNAAPEAFTKFCANCHGAHGEGATQGKLHFPALLGVGSKPRRSVSDIVGLLNDPPAYGLEAPMRSFATKLTDDEKKQIAEWVVKLK